MSIDVSSQADKAVRFRELHHLSEPLVLVNAWDAVSARIVESLGFPALATTSAGVAWAHGYADGEKISREAMLSAVAEIVRVVRVPVTADLEAGYGNSAEDAAATARGAITAGAVGLNFEDSTGDPSRPLVRIEDQVECIRAIRAIGDALGVPVVINARTDVFLLHTYEGQDDGLAQSVERAKAYIAAGADSIFVPGVTQPELIAQLVRSIEAPLNVLAAGATPPVGELRRLGVHRISLGSGTIGYALAMFKDITLEVRDHGTFGFLTNRISHADLNALFSDIPGDS